MRPRRHATWVLCWITALVIAAGVPLAAVAGNTGGLRGTFRISTTEVDSIDPAISLGQTVFSLTCVHLMTYPDKPRPAGLRLVPEVASSYPVVSRHGKTYTFAIRSGFTFSTGEKVTAESFAHAIDRVLSPTANSPSSGSMGDIVGAQAMLAGKATRPSGVQVHGNRLVVHLTHAARDFPARTSTSPFCAVPASLPISAEGFGAPFPGAGPYYVAEFASQQKLVLKRNPFYRGSRPHHVDEFDYAFYANDNAAVHAVENGTADYVDNDTPSTFANISATYRSRLHVFPGSGIRTIVLNSSQPLFRANAALRRAVSYAIDRTKLTKLRGQLEGRPSDQYLTPTLPGYREADIYPSHPNVAKARQLAGGATRSGQAILFVQDRPDQVAQAQVIQANLKPIGIAVKIMALPGPAMFQKLFTPGTKFDMALVGFGPEYPDPYDVLNTLFDGRLIGTPYSFNLGHFASAAINARLDAASRLSSARRYQAYGALDVDLARNYAPLVTYASENVVSLVSKRVGCLVFTPSLDLAAACLK